VAESGAVRARDRSHAPRQLALPYERPEHLSHATAHRVNGLLQSIAASVAIVRMTGADSERGGRAAAEILERARQIGEIVASLARDER
jgi:hypothetical protein